MEASAASEVACPEAVGLVEALVDSAEVCPEAVDSEADGDA